MGEAFAGIGEGLRKGGPVKNRRNELRSKRKNGRNGLGSKRKNGRSGLGSEKKLRERARRLGDTWVWKTLVQLVFPLRCPVCDEIVTPFGEKICLDCLKKLRYVTPPRCLRCGRGLEDGEKEYCRDCAAGTHFFRRGRALYEYESVAPALYRFKYQNRREYADFYGEEVARYLGDFLKEIHADGLVPVPLHRRRYRKRGYNQAELLARAVGRYTGLAVYDGIVKRVKNTTPLKLLNPQERQNNLKKAFHITENDVKLSKTLRSVVIVDDIYTTGSTIDAVSSVLLEAGVERVYFITLACGKRGQ